MTQAQKRGRGRPSTFDRTEALREAMKLFWDRGYEGTSFDDLVACMGISPSSFYNTFGSKEQLYREVTDHFLHDAMKWIKGALNEEGADTRTAVSHLLRSAADEFTHEDLPRGCMISLHGTHQSPDLTPIREMMSDHRASSEVYLAERIRKGMADGDMPPHTDVEGLAAYIHTIVRGLAVLARDGASRERLQHIGEIAMQAWPAHATHH
jgi:AcrR family transcriptional regulator